MIDLPDISTFTAVLADGRIPLALAIAGISGAARGFSGFGSGLIFVPLISALYEPRIAVASLVLIDFASGAPFAFYAFPGCDWRNAAPLTFTAVLTIPLGALLLVLIDPILLRWVIGIIILLAIPILTAGWRYHTKPALPITLGVGAIAGILEGSAQIAGPAVVLYWLGGPWKATVARANLILFLAITDVAVMIALWFRNLFTAETLALTILLAIPYTALFVLGIFSHHRASETFYRRVCYTLIAMAALFSLPVFDRFFH